MEYIIFAKLGLDTISTDGWVLWWAASQFIMQHITSNYSCLLHYDKVTEAHQLWHRLLIVQVN